MNQKAENNNDRLPWFDGLFNLFPTALLAARSGLYIPVFISPILPLKMPPFFTQQSIVKRGHNKSLTQKAQKTKQKVFPTIDQSLTFSDS